MQIKNEAMLITYSDSMGSNMKDLKGVLDKHFKGAIRWGAFAPILPVYRDRGFAPSDYTRVDPSLGTWEDVDALGEQYYLMFDFMINHISRESKFFQDFKENHENSPYKDMFIRIHEFFPRRTSKPSGY